MAKFKNIVTGNVLTTTEKTTLDLMRKSARYTEITETGDSADSTAKTTATAKSKA